MKVGDLVISQTGSDLVGLVVSIGSHWMECMPEIFVLWSGEASPVGEYFRDLRLLTLS
jgi:hypothetical protein